MLQEIPTEYRLIFLLDIVIAVRAGELLGLRWLDFRPEQGASRHPTWVKLALVANFTALTNFNDGHGRSSTYRSH